MKILRKSLTTQNREWDDISKKILVIMEEVYSEFEKHINEVSKLDLSSLKPDYLSDKRYKEYLAKGINSSKWAVQQEQLVAMTPLMKNALIHYGDLRDGDDRAKITVDSKQTKAEAALISNIKQLLETFNGKERDFDESQPLRSKDHYDVQCWKNFKDNMRDIQPGQSKQRFELLTEYTTTTRFGFDAIKRVMKDPVFRKAVNIVAENIPSVTDTTEIREINLPFMTKHTGVGFPFWGNDRTTDPHTGKTFAQLTMDIAESIKDKPHEWWKYNVTTAYGRNQRGKGRLILAASRVLNLVLNQLEANEIMAYKNKSSLFTGYNNHLVLKNEVVKLVEYCERNNLKCANEDYSKFDSTIGLGLVLLCTALSIYKANGSRAKMIARKRGIFAMHSFIISGYDKIKDKNIWGRIFSGYIDTNRMGGIINAILMTYDAMKQDPKYSKLAYDAPHYMLVMGDDNLHIYNPEAYDRSKTRKFLGEEFGVEIHDDKYEYGPTFLQYRLFKNEEGTNSFVYAWTRVVRSMLFKEKSKGLGPVGWTYAFYQQLGKLLDYKPAFSLAVNLLIRFDKNQFYRNVPIEELNQMLKSEDNKAFVELKTEAQRAKHMSSVTKLYDGDPSKSAQSIEDSDFLRSIQKAINEVYDPDFYKKHGLI